MHNHTNKTREDNNIFEGEYQVKLPASVAISKQNPAAILRAVFERMDWSVLQGRYSPLGRIEDSSEGSYGIAGLRVYEEESQQSGIEKACKENLKYMFLLDGRLEVKFHMPESVETRHLKEALKKLELEKARTETEFVHGTGKRKSGVQKAYEALETWLKRMREYRESLRVCGKRNSDSKTDPDATFMRMKEERMKNGQ